MPATTSRRWATRRRRSCKPEIRRELSAACRRTMSRLAFCSYANEVASRSGAFEKPAMAKISAADGVKLYVEAVGCGTPVVFVHEYAGDYRSWEPQLRYFCRRHRCVTFSQRGYPPSDVPSDPARYSQVIARDDVVAVMDALGIDRAHVVGHSMGAYTALHVGITYPQRCISVTAAGCGWGSTPDPARREAMQALAAETGKMFADEGIVSAAAKYAD